jgi:hypothetical protein
MPHDRLARVTYFVVLREEHHHHGPHFPRFSTMAEPPPSQELQRPASDPPLGDAVPETNDSHPVAVEAGEGQGPSVVRNDADPAMIAAEADSEDGQRPAMATTPASDHSSNNNNNESDDRPAAADKEISVSELVYAVDSFNVIYKPGEGSSERWESQWVA